MGIVVFLLLARHLGAAPQRVDAALRPTVIWLFHGFHAAVATDDEADL